MRLKEKRNRETVILEERRKLWETSWPKQLGPGRTHGHSGQGGQLWVLGTKGASLESVCVGFSPVSPKKKKNLKIREGKRLAQGHTAVLGQKKQFPDSWPRILFLMLSYLPPLCRSHFCWENKGVEFYLLSFLPFY